MSLLVATDNETRVGKARRGPRLSKCTALAALGLWALPAQAQEAGATASKVRRVVLAKVPQDHPATVYGAAGKPLLLRFATPIGAGAIRAPGVEVRRVPGDRNTVILTPPQGPSPGPIPVVVPLPNGSAKLTLLLKPELTARRVYVVRPEEPGPAGRGGVRHLMTALATQPTVTLDSPYASIPDAAVQCRVNLRVRTPEAPRGAAVEIRSADRSLCGPASTLGMRVDGAR